MPRMSKKRRLEWSFFLNSRNRITYNDLTLHELQTPPDTAHARIYDRLISMCSPVRFTGKNFRKAAAQERLGALKGLMNGGTAYDR